jgi:Spy/CpxP family protein refolding chaperone
MKSVVRTLLTLALAVVIASPLLAAEGKRGKKAPPQDPAAGLLKSLEKAELTPEQVTKIKELAAAAAEKMKAADEKVGLTPEQKKARQEAQAKAKADGKTGKEAQAAVDEALKLTDEQKAAMKEANELRAALRKEAAALLTPEQKAKAGIKEGKKRAKN